MKYLNNKQSNLENQRTRHLYILYEQDFITYLTLSRLMGNFIPTQKYLDYVL